MVSSMVAMLGNKRGNKETACRVTRITNNVTDVETVDIEIVNAGLAGRINRRFLLLLGTDRKVYQDKLVIA